MYEKVIAFTLIYAAVSAFDTPAPFPDFPDNSEFTQVGLPSEEDVGDFPLVIDFAGWALWENPDEAGLLKSWIAESSWTGLENYAPDGEVFGGIVHFSETP